MGFQPGDLPHSVSLRRPIALRCGRTHVTLAVRFDYVLEPDRDPRSAWAVAVTGYDVSIHDSGIREVVVFHWHPRGRSGVRRPHLHVGPASLDPDGLLTRKHHVPTGLVSIEEIVRFLVSDLGVKVRRRHEAVYAEHLRGLDA